MRLNQTIWITLAMALVTGCSSSEVDEVAKSPSPSNQALASTLPVVTALEKTDGLANVPDEPIAPFEEDLDFFTPPKMIIPIETEEPEESFSGELPPLRLVGFVGNSGEKAMVAVDGEMHLVTAGKRLNGVEIVSVKSPHVALRWGETDLTLDFYKPSKSDRPRPETRPSSLSSPAMTRLDKRSESPAPAAAPPRPAPAPRPQFALPSLPGLPTAGNSTPQALADFPELGVGPGTPPAP